MNDKKVFENLLKIIEQYHFSQRSGKYLEYRNPTELRGLLELERPEKNGDWQEIFDWVEKYLTYSVKTNHPMFVNRMWVGANLPSIVGEIVAAVTNTSACTYESAPVSTLMEKYMIGRMLELVGFKNGEGQMTTGSSNANMIAMMTARNMAANTIKQAGMFGQRKLFAFVGADAHYSMDRAANILGIGADQLIKVPLDPLGAMIPAELERAVDRVLAGGGQPFFVVATAGTTVRGGYDSIEALLALREKYGFWLHVDGAWGGAAVFSEKLRNRYLRGLEEADSFTCDFHKMLGSSLMCNILLINKRTDALATVLCAGDGSYLFRNENIDGMEDLGTASLQCGRRVDSLKWFLDWKFFGREGLARRVEKNLDLCKYAEELVKASDHLELVVPRTSFNVCFRFKVPAEDNNSFNLALRTGLYRDGTSLVGLAYIDGELAMRLLVTNPAAERADIDTFFGNLIAKGQELLQELDVSLVADC
ncbi:MAG: pyridoxal-dependent decarboxylase [Desulfobulbaceae bacterium BRH_c16a]|nr:MAG: pyridoxal-dependent decarboxylase [Desulfobulbaceae bacterium BRH_c16a]